VADGARPINDRSDVRFGLRQRFERCRSRPLPALDGQPNRHRVGGIADLELRGGQQVHRANFCDDAFGVGIAPALQVRVRQVIHRMQFFADIAKIDACLDQLRKSGNTYWATQTEVLAESARAWQLQANGQADAATQHLRAAADKEDAIEKRPVTPGPIVPAREQLGEMLLELDHPQEALREFQIALTNAPGRRGALTGAMQAAERVGDAQAAAKFRAQLNGESPAMTP